jgi:hypothetical protein
MSSPNSISDQTGSPSGAEVSVAELAASGVPIAWFEAVAVAQQICRWLLNRDAALALDWERVFVQSSGEIDIRSAEPAAPETVVQSLGELLRTWLAETPYPMPLRLVVAQATTVPPFYKSIPELFDALSHYERSNRLELVREVYEQWRTAEPPSETTADESDDPFPQKLWSIGESTLRKGGALLRTAGGRWKSMRERSIVPPPDAEALNTFQQEGSDGTLDAVLPVRRDKRVMMIAAAALLSIAVTVWALASGVERSVAKADDHVVNSLASAFGGALNWLGTYSGKARTGSFKPLPNFPPAPPPEWAVVHEEAHPPAKPAVTSTPVQKNSVAAAPAKATPRQLQRRTPTSRLRCHSISSFRRDGPRMPIKEISGRSILLWIRLAM